MQVMAALQEIYASRATIEHFMMGCLLLSFQGKSLQVQSMLVKDINSDKVGPGMQLEEVIYAYSAFIVMMNSIDGLSCGINGVGQGDRKNKGGAGAKFKGKCNNCGKTRHKSKDCTKGTQNPVGNINQKPLCNHSKKDWCKYCLWGPHKERDCYTKRQGSLPI